MSLDLITKEYLEQNRIAPHARGWRCYCPNCSGNDLYDSSEENGRVHCFNCQSSFKLAGQERRSIFYNSDEVAEDILGIRSLYHSTIDIYQSCLQSEHIDYLNRRGIERETIESFKIGFCPSSTLSIYQHPLTRDAGLADRGGHPSLRNRITFGYLAETFYTDIRGRTFLGEEPKYKSLYNASYFRGATFTFNWDRAIEKARERKYIILTEGEIKAVVADQFGFPCTALPGMVSWRRDFIPDPEWRVIVMFDNAKDLPSRVRVNKAIERVMHRIPRALIATIPLLGDEKQDIDSFLIHKSGGPARFQRIIDDAITYNRYQQLRRF